MTRLWGTRNIALGGIAATTTDDATRRNALAAVAAMNVIDTAIAMVTPGLSPQTRVMAAASSAVFAGLAGFRLTQRAS